VSATSLARLREPPAAPTAGRPPAPSPGSPGLTADDVRDLAGVVAGDVSGDGTRRAAARQLAAAAMDDPALLTPDVLRRLDVALPALLRPAGVAAEADAPALVALCAALGDRLTRGVCPELQVLVRRADPPVAVAAHVASLLVEGLVPSRQHLADLTAVVDADPRVLAASRDRPPRVRAAALAYALAVA
jgi:hypothetical protein